MEHDKAEQAHEKIKRLLELRDSFPDGTSSNKEVVTLKKINDNI